MSCEILEKRILALPLALNAALVLALCAMSAGCGKKEISLVVKTGVHPLAGVVDDTTPDAFTFLEKASQDFTRNYKDAKVSIEVFQYESERHKKELDECFGTKNSPDIVFASQFNLSAYAHKGKIVPLDDMIDAHIRDDIPVDIWENCVIDGRTYMIPFVTAQNVLCFNKKLFRQAGLDRLCGSDDVQSWTLVEWEDVLSSLKKSLPPASYPMMMYAADDQGDTHIMLLLRSRGCKFFDMDGRVDIDNDEGLAALEWLRSSGKRGFFPPHPERLVIMDNSELFTSGQLAIYIANAAIQSIFDEAGIECGYVNFPSSGGAGFNSSFDMSFAVVDNGDEDKIKAAKAFIKYIYGTSWLDYSAGGIPASARVAKKYAPELAVVSRYINNSGRNVNFSNNSPNWLGVRAVFWRRINELFATSNPVEQIAREIEDDCNAAIDKGRAESRPLK